MNDLSENDKCMWYILRYRKDFIGNLSDQECMRKIQKETGEVSI